MRGQELNSQLDELMGSAIRSELRNGQNNMLVERVMNNIYAIQNNPNYKTIERKLNTMIHLINGFSIAASILLGYIIGHIYIASTTAHIIRVSFENLNISTIGIG